MTQSPVSVTYLLEDVLNRLEQNIDKQFEEINRKIDKLDDRFNDKIDRFENRINDKIEKNNDLLNEKIDKIDERFTEKINKFDERLNQLEIGQTEIKGEIKALDEKVNGLSKRLENQEFVNRGLLIALIVAILGGFAKLFGLIGNPL